MRFQHFRPSKHAREDGWVSCEEELATEAMQVAVKRNSTLSRYSYFEALLHDRSGTISLAFDGNEPEGEIVQVNIRDLSEPVI